jgi:hypothetical protein
MKSFFTIVTVILLCLSGCKPSSPTETVSPHVEKDRAVSLATEHVKKQYWQKEYVLTAPAKVEELPTYWEVFFGRPSDRQADPAFGIVRVDKTTEEVTVIPQK